jgi:tRNA-2-methylthio-N6-dimethylallyladenosine synthase
MDFSELISAIAEIDGDFLIRFMTSHPKDTSDKLIAAMAKYKDKIAPYFHLPLQSGSNSVLKRMNRTYTRERFMSIVEALRENIPNICLSTDVIVGFPGESEEDFEDTLDILRRAEIDSAYAFLYSPREGTPAAKMQDQIPDEIKSERINRLFALQDKISYEKNLPYLEGEHRVLVDSVNERDGVKVYSGRTASNKLVHFTAESASVGDFTKVKINKIGGFDLIGAEIK